MSNQILKDIDIQSVNSKEQMFTYIPNRHSTRTSWKEQIQGPVIVQGNVYFFAC